MRLENDTTDKSISDVDVAINHSIKTRAISGIQETSTTAEFLLRYVLAEMKARGAGTIVTTLFKDMISAGTAIAIPAPLSMVSAAGAGVVSPKLDLSTENTINFQIQFSLNVVDQELEIYSMLYGIEVRRLPQG